MRHDHDSVLAPFQLCCTGAVSKRPVAWGDALQNYWWRCVWPAAQAFCMDPEAQECTLSQPADPVSYKPQTHLSNWARR